MSYRLPLAAAVLLCTLNPTFADELVEEQVLVTATRLPTNADNLPLSWSSIDQQAINLAGQVHINELMQQVPGAWISRGNGQESLPSLRSPVLTGAGSCGAFYMAADGIALRAPGFCNVNQLFDANTEQAGAIEVIKGPATALYGSNAMHGVINILSAAPDVPEHSIALEAGPHDYYRGKYRYAGSAGAHKFGISFNGTSDGGYKADSGFDQQKLTLRDDYQGENWSITSVLDYANLNQETAGFITGYKAYADEDLKDTNPNPEAYRDARSVRAYSRMSRDLDGQNTLVVTPYLRDNSMEFLMHFLPWQPVEENGHTSLGLQSALHTEAGNWAWTNGADLDYTDGWLKETQAEPFSPNQPAGVHYDYQVDALSAALFSQATWAAERLELSGGARLEYNRYDYNNRTDDGPACSPEASACRFYRPADREDDFTGLSLNAGVNYQWLDDHSAYLRLARGFRAPQATELYRLQSGQEVADLDEEELDSIEMGLRGNITDKFSYTASLYYMEKDEVIFQDANRQNVSGASTEHQGLELSIDYSFTENWYLNAVASVARHRYASAIELLGSSGDIKGNDIDTAPRHTGSARLGWNFNDSSTAELEWIYLGSHYLEPDNQHKYDGHELVNLRVSSAFNESWSGALRVTNLLDEDYAERADFGFGSYRYFVGEPLGVYAEVRYSLR
ncbi:TonB-dependent receptor [Halioglobus japonicus]|uniref:TonB-dependent receptor n=1 Tax=Halioglobus japonicus TaxID=930805 RepID=A0AAP8MH41_9GAMM|nr:TonB-dependent receptor [Halioglobus japonicus]AQA19370.1 TonB-dependent receptor [Halioglobus japonicus]PLW87579.1 TonB-dependent receptor [Halioglobus japonicus]GHD07705.1 TonB-dependent receptor [Halioglobus japonicus]